MNTQTRTGTAPGFELAALPPGAPAAARAVFRLLARLRHGRLDVQLPDGSSASFGSLHDAGDTRAAIRLRNWQVCAAALKSGDIGFAEGYIAGDWSTPDLAALLKLFVANRNEIESVVYGRWWGAALYRLRHLLNRNSRAGSRKNIHAHYDLGNAFYKLWLDETMSYSSAWFDGDPARGMVEGQLAKVRRALREAGVRLHLSEVKGPVMDRLGGTDLLRELSGRVFLTHYQAVGELTPEVLRAS